MGTRKTKYCHLHLFTSLIKKFQLTCPNSKGTSFIYITDKKISAHMSQLQRNWPRIHCLIYVYIYICVSMLTLESFIYFELYSFMLHCCLVLTSEAIFIVLSLSYEPPFKNFSGLWPVLVLVHGSLKKSNCFCGFSSRHLLKLP